MPHSGLQIEPLRNTQSIARFQAEHARLQSWIDSAYVDSLDGHIDKATFKDLANSWRKEQTRILDEIALHQVADQG